jgi:hypothetical protein
MPLINLVLVLIVVGVGLWMINRFIPMASSIKTILNVVVVVAVCVWVLKAVGLWGDISSFRIGSSAPWAGKPKGNQPWTTSSSTTQSPDLTDSPP